MIKHSMKAVAVATVVGGMIAGAVSASAALNLPTQSCSYTFATNMRLGSRGTDVMNLQKVLNMYPQTRVAATGAGSPGMETTYFGAGTRAAVNKFQQLHLVELGITAPTGNVFAGTRGLLNQVCNGTVGTNPGTTPGTPGTTGPVSAMLSANQPTGMVVQGQSGARLADITFTGNGTVTAVQLQRTGVSTDSTLTNVYLYDGNTRITDAASVVTGGYINFNAPSGLFTVSGSRTLTVRADIAGSTSGQSIGVKLNSVTANGAVSSFTNVMGNNLQIANVTTASVNLVMGSGSATVNAGTMNHIVWSANGTVSTRDVNLRAATFKFVGSAPVDAIANLSLYVDGTKVAGPAMVNAANNNKVTFDLGNTPYLLKTGTRLIEVRGDVVKGSARTYTFSIENVADLMLEDSNLSGVNVSATVSSNALTQSNSAYTTTTISTGSVTVNSDPAFSATTVTGGATNVPIGQFTLKAYGEDVKINTLRVAIATTTNASLTTFNNVSLYVNGGQVGTSQNYTVSTQQTGYLTFTLGSSLIVPAGQTVTLTVKADIVDSSNAAYSSGTITVSVGGGGSSTNNAQGMSSNEIVDVAGSAVTSNVLTISSGAASFARTSGFTAYTVAPNTNNVKIGSFSLQAGSAEDVKVNSIAVKPVPATYDETNLSNLRVVSNGVTLGTPVGNPASGTTTFSFADITIPMNSSRTFDVYADIGSATSGSVTTAMGVTYRGAVSNTTVTGTSAAGVAITSAASTLSDASLASASPVAQFVVGGSTFGIATFNLKTASAGTVANVRKLQFTTTGTDAIESITVGGVTAQVVGSGTTTVAGLNIPIGSTGTDVPVVVKFSGFQGGASGGNLQASIASVYITLGNIEATSGSGSVITNVTPVSSNTMKLVGSKPTVTVGSGSGSGEIVLGAENKIGEFTVTADANGKIGVASTSLTVSTQGITNPQISSARVADGNTTISGSAVTGSSTLVISFDTATSPSWYEIPAGQSKTFSVYATVSGDQTSSTVTPYVTTRLTSTATFKWVDILGGNSEQTGASIYNFPTNSFVTSH